MSYLRQKTLGRYGRQLSEPTAQSFTFPACVEGVNAVDSLMQMSPASCIYTYNMMPSEYGMRLRKGYREWATGCIESPQRADDVTVRSIIPFESNIQDATNDRLFAATAEGIWNVTLFNTLTPNQEVTFSDTSGAAGYGVWAEFTGDAAGEGLRGHYLFYADGINGIWQYEEANDTWTQPLSAGGTGDQSAPPAIGSWYYLNPDGLDVTDPLYFLPFEVSDIAFVMIFKQRIWVILEDDDDAWYLPTASVSGELVRFTFGSKLPHGGNLMGLWRWTIDGGDGVDDMMVAISRGGDVIVYQGEDPEITPDGSSIGPWSTRGTWFVGEVPESRRIVIDIGPDLYILSTFGLTSLNDLLQGAPMTGGTPSKKINRFLRADVQTAKNSLTWQLVVHPADGFLQVITPKPSNTPHLQYNQNIQTSAWGFWEGVPITCAASWNGSYLMGGDDGVVYINDGVLDGTGIAKGNHWQNDPVSVGVGWSVPAVDEYLCDGSQVAETKYTVNAVIPIVEGTIYTVFYRVKANPRVQRFQDVTSVAPGPEWTVPIPLEFNCDGTQVAETNYTTTLITPLKAGVRYLVTYAINNFVAGNHKITVGGVDFAAYTTGDGQFSGSFTPTQEETDLSLTGDEDFDGTFLEVVVSLFDGEGSHKMQSGTDDIGVPRTGSGAFSTTFTAPAAETQLSLVGDEDFTGTFFEVSMRVESTEGAAIGFRLLTSFQSPAGHSNFTMVGFIRTIGILAGSAALNISAVYDYKIENITTAPVAVGSTGDNVWDSAVWDNDLWDFSVEGKSFPSGTLGVGRSFAVGMSGSANTRLNIVGWDVIYKVGGQM